MNKLKAVSLAAMILAASGPVLAATVTNTFQAQIVIQNACRVDLTSPTTLNFGTQGVLAANVDTTSTINLTCSTSTPYDVALNAGANPATAGDVTTRRMANGSSYVSYQMYSDSGRTTVWGNSTTNDVSGTGNGSAQTLTVYGRVPSQTTPAAGTYTDTVTITVTY